jgi:hypothetical protein
MPASTRCRSRSGSTPTGGSASAMGGIERYERRHRWFEQNRSRFADALE